MSHLKQQRHAEVFTEQVIYTLGHAKMDKTVNGHNLMTDSKRREFVCLFALTSGSSQHQKDIQQSRFCLL